MDLSWSCGGGAASQGGGEGDVHELFGVGEVGLVVKEYAVSNAIKTRKVWRYLVKLIVCARCCEDVIRMKTLKKVGGEKLDRSGKKRK